MNLETKNQIRYLEDARIKLDSVTNILCKWESSTGRALINAIENAIYDLSYEITKLKD